MQVSQPESLAESKAAEESKVESFSLPFSTLRGVVDIRLDASHYNPGLISAINTLENCGMRLVRLESVTNDVFMPPRFKRNYVEADHGVPFLQGSHVVHFQPADMKFLSRASHKNLPGLMIREGWLLITRSGTVGRSVICPAEWDGWAASEHIIRIVPDEIKCQSGYLWAFLTSPLGQVQLSAHIHGAVVDELTVDQIKSVIVPLPASDADVAIVASIDRQAKLAVEKKSEAVALAEEAAEVVTRRIDHEKDACP